MEPRATLHGGPRDGNVVPEYFSARIRFPRYRDDGRLVHDIYEASRGRGEPGAPRSYRYAGEEIPPQPDPSAWEPTRRERRREYWARLGRAIRGRA